MPHNPPQAAYHSIGLLYIRGSVRVPHSRVGAEPLLVSAPAWLRI